MCGLFASFGLTPSPAAIAAVAHRGPDGEGWQELPSPRGPLVLAHRRLAIIDTSEAGHQPMQSGNGRWWVVYNGEIYNHVELRTELAALGHSFISRTDTEVLLAAYAQWGEDCLNRFNGMFAFVLWDARERRLFAARDRFGVKPLYWWVSGQGMAFASEIKQFTHLPRFRSRLNRDAVYSFLCVGLFDHDGSTLFDGVRQLRGGECLSIDLNRPDCADTALPRRWYRQPEPGSLNLPADQAISRFRELFTDSVRLRLRSDVPVGSCLSGGLDSSSIVCVASGIADTRMTTISACYEDQGIDERRFINIVNGHVPTQPVHVFPDGSELIGTLDRLVHHQDGPFASTSVFAQWCVFQAARREGIPVMLDGQGADEQLCGYHPAFDAYHSSLLRRLSLGRLAREIKAQRRRHGVSAAWQAAILGRALLPDFARHAIRRFRGTERPPWLAPGFAAGRRTALPALRSLEELISSQTYHTSLPALLHYEDRNSMAHGVESRLPFLDYRLVELAVALGARHKIVDGETKWLLRRAMDTVLPPAIAARQDKIGFATPEKDWLAGPARSLVETNMDEALARFPTLFETDAVRRLKDDTLCGRRRMDFTLWRIISFGAWARVFDVASDHA